MPTKRYKPEQIVTLLRQIEVDIANGKMTPQACKEAQITLQTYYRWRKEFGGLKLDQAKPLKELERENGCCGSFNGKLRDECLNGEIFYSLKDAQIVIEKWRMVYNTQRKRRLGPAHTAHLSASRSMS
jgi:hypothetical protein